MRTSYQRPVPRSNNAIPWKWIGVMSIIAFIFWFSSHFGKSDTSTPGNSLIEISLGTGSEVYTIDSKGVKKQMNKSFSFKDEVSTISVVNGTVEGKNTVVDAFIDKATEIAYKKVSIDTLEILRGRSWIESKGNINIHLKNIDISLKDGDIVLVEQNQVYSTLYVFHGSILIQAGSLKYSVEAGKRIMVAHSDILNPSLSLENLSGPIDDGIKQNPFFLARNGERLLSELQSQSSSGATVGSGVLLNSGSFLSSGTSISLNGKYIEITSPQDGSTTNTPTIKITGKILSQEVKRVTINESNAVVSPVDASFSISNFSVSTEVTNIVYKAFSSDGNMLERGVITVYTKNTKKGSEKLSPNNFPIADKNYRILIPSENPYKTTESNVTVQGVVPKDTVNYIMVNNFRLKQFKPYGTNWYYYANMTYSTMKDGINLYEIRFYGSNDELLSTQLFTIVKESKITPLVSGETR